MITLFDQYDADLDLTDKDDRKLFTDAYRGIKEKDLFNGKKESYNDFVKLTETPFEEYRLTEALVVPTK